jgi:hypothetical protein
MTPGHVVMGNQSEKYLYTVPCERDLNGPIPY